ncbi:MAG TPA: PDDEXK nuclease domain-containing protein [Syntrophorhabdus sp.]|nr:PDDEXK nuclease domain-containing protein [Syntrophorhabdus sp.]
MGKEKDKARIFHGRQRDNALFPAVTSHAHLPQDYGEVLHEIKNRIRLERQKVALAANSVMILLYWDIGRIILERQDQAGWGAKVIDRLSMDLRDAFPDMDGFSPRNLKYMRAFALAWQDRVIVQRGVAQLPWRHNIALIERLNNEKERLWYANQAIQNGWSQPVMVLQIENCAHERQGKAISNFSETLPPADSDMAEQVFKDPYLFDFLGSANLRREREVEQALVDHIQRFLLELGTGFAFVGRQVLLEVGGQDFYLDLLFYHLKLRCYIVIELKVVPFDPAFVGQLNLYLSATDDLLRHPDDNPSIGLLICRSKDKIVVEYALRDLKKPISVAQWETKIVKSIPKELKGLLPTVKEIEAEIK